MDQQPTPRRTRRFQGEGDMNGQMPVQPSAPVYPPVQQQSPVYPQQPMYPPQQAYPPQGAYPPPQRRRQSAQPMPQQMQRPAQPPMARPQTMARPQQAKAAVQEKEQLPKVMVVTACVLLVLCMACIAAFQLSRAHVKTLRDERQAAYTRVVNNHPLQYRDLIEKYSGQYNLQPAFVSAIILNESSYNTRAESGVGARGLMQLMPDTAKWIAHRLGEDSTYTDDALWDAETNIRFGCWYLNYLSKTFAGQVAAVTGAYHAGQGEISTWLRNSTYAPDGILSQETMPDGPTKTYTGRVMRDYGIYDALYFGAYNHLSAGPVSIGDSRW